jgi:hypothetical protein
MNIVKHGKSVDTADPEKKILQADLIALMKKVIHQPSCKFGYAHVYGHLDNILQ